MNHYHYHPHHYPARASTGCAGKLALAILALGFFLVLCCHPLFAVAVLALCVLAVPFVLFYGLCVLVRWLWNGFR